MDIGFRAPFTSLGARLFAMLLLAVTVVLAAYATISYRSTREHLVEIVSSDAHRMSQLIHRATHYAMLLN